MIINKIAKKKYKIKKALLSNKKTKIMMTVMIVIEKMIRYEFIR